MAGLKGRPQPERLPHPSPRGAYSNAYALALGYLCPYLFYLS
jgi:hypothetical protein